MATITKVIVFILAAGLVTAKQIPETKQTSDDGDAYMYNSTYESNYGSSGGIMDYLCDGICADTNVIEPTPSEESSDSGIMDMMCDVLCGDVVDQSDWCHSDQFGGPGGAAFEMTAQQGQRIEAIQLCGSGHSRFEGLAAGFQLMYSDATFSEEIGCEDRVDMFSPIILDYDEVITQVDIYHGTNNGWDAHVIQALAFTTTTNQYGPYGVTEDATMETVYGHNLVGFSGTVGFVLDKLGVVFETC